MDECAITKYITETFAGVDVVVVSGGTFFFYDLERRFPFATLVTSDEYDQFSDLNRPGIFRLNVGIGKQTFQTMFGPVEGHDFTALDRLLPHPVYGKMCWVCVLNPSDATFESVMALLAEGYEIAVGRQAKRGEAQ